MNECCSAVGLLFQAVARARRTSILAALETHGMEELGGATLSWLLVGEGGEPEDGDRLLRVCRVVDERMLAGFSTEDLALISTLLFRLLRSLKAMGEW